MLQKPRFARVSITLPREVLVAADQEAAAAGRPRSWVVAEAIRQYRGGPGAVERAPEGASDVAAARRQHLAADLRLSAEERLRRATGLLRLARRGRGPGRAQVIGFETYEDFYAWKRARRAEGLPRT